jgi:chorismate mutase
VFGAIVSPIKESNHKLADVGPFAAMAELQDLRDSIDNLDASIIHMLAERFRCTEKVGVLKARHNLPPSDPGKRRSKLPVSANLRLLLNLIQSLRKSFLPLSFVKSFGIMKPPGADALDARCQHAAESSSIFAAFSGRHSHPPEYSISSDP